jgi:RHS repeat-associated protein
MASAPADGHLRTSSIRYSYAPGKKRVWRGVGTPNGTGQWSTSDVITFWSVNGQKLAEYAVTATQGCCGGTDYYIAPQYYVTQTSTNYYFGSKLIKNGNGDNWVYSDRLGSIGKFYPYGIERTSPLPQNGTEKFTGYFRDAESGNDYAGQRYTSPGMGRFITPDRGTGGARPSNPGTWNLYAYSGGDPINNIDPLGAEYCSVDFCVTGTGSAGDGTIGSGGPVGNSSGGGNSSNPQCGLLAEDGAAGNPAAVELYETYCATQPVGGFPFAGGIPTLNNAPASVAALFNTVFQDVIGILANNSNCDQVFGVGELKGILTPDALLAALEAPQYYWGVCVNANALACTVAGNPTTVTISATSSPNFNTTSNSSSPINGLPSFTALQLQEFILLHELGHLTGGTANQNDQNGGNNAFNQAIVTNCLGMVVKQ